MGGSVFNVLRSRCISVFIKLRANGFDPNLDELLSS